MPITTTQAWDEAAATVDANEVMLVTLELQHSEFRENGVITPIRAVLNTEDVQLRIESGATFNAEQLVTFKAIPFGIEYPRIGNLSVEAPVWIDNVNREVSKYLEPATKTNENVVVVFRGYLASDPNTVGQGPYRLVLRNVKRKGGRLEGTLTIADPSKFRVMKEIYDNARFPALMIAAGA